MNPFLQQQCEFILDKLQNKPIGRILDSKWTDTSGKLTASIIRNKLSRQKYITPFDFSLDVKLLLEPRNDGSASNMLQNMILEDINNWFDNKIVNIPRSEEEFEYMKIQKQLKKLKLIIRALLFSAEKTPKQIIDTAQHRPIPPTREGPQPNQKRIEVLQQRIDHLKRPEDIQNVLRILQKHIPHLGLSQEVIIEGRLITKACANELRTFLNSINA